MSDPVRFYFDFSSPYSYFSAHKIDATVAGCGRECVWKPFLLGALFKITGAQPLIQIPMKDDYCIRDWQRMGQMMDIPWTLPAPFPVATYVVARAFYWLDDQDPVQAKAFALAAFRAYFARGVDISVPETVLAIAADLGADPVVLGSALDDPALKQRLRDETQAAIDAGVFGAPFFIVDGEAFWGNDRLWMLRRWIRGQKA